MIPDEIDKAGGDYMRQMTDRSCDVIVRPAVQCDRNRADCLNKLCEGLYFFLLFRSGRRENIVGILNQNRLGIHISGFFLILPSGVLR